jgi:ABC-type Fe3+-siderophore transport system, permease component
MSKQLYFVIFLVLSLLLLTQGATPILHVLENISASWNPLLHERLPRLIVIFCTGASLAVSGAVMQALFQNPLATPYVLGTSLGGSLSVFLVFLFGWHLTHPFMLALAAFGGCLATLIVVYLLTINRNSDKNYYLILTGLAVSTFLLAIQGALVYIFRDHWSFIQTWMEWEAGSTIDRTWAHVHQQLPLTLVGVFGCFFYRSELNLLSLGDEEALMLGVEVKKVRFRLFLCVSLLTAGSLAGCGNIPFFGLVLPHIVRQIQGANNVTLIPKCIYWGAVSMIGMDWLMRYLNIQMLSIGQVSAFLGGLFFLFLVIKPKVPYAHA